MTVNADGTITYVANAGSSGSDSFIYTICSKAQPSNCDTALVLLTITSGKVSLLPKVYLQGSLFGVVLPDTLMRDDLRSKGYLPTVSPYSSGLTTVGSANSSVFGVTGHDAIVDWVFVELRKGSDSTLVVDSRSALLQRDGDVVDVDGVSNIKFDQVLPGDYYVVIKHRNHLGVMSKKVSRTEVAKTIDFRKVVTSTFVLSLSTINQSQVNVEQGKAMWAGNAQSDNSVIYQGTLNDVNVIYQQVINAPNNLFVIPAYKLRGYYAGDINMNGEVIFQGTGNDVEYIYQNIINNHPGNTLKLNYFKSREQLP